MHMNVAPSLHEPSPALLTNCSRSRPFSPSIAPLLAHAFAARELWTCEDNGIMSPKIQMETWQVGEGDGERHADGAGDRHSVRAQCTASLDTLTSCHSRLSRGR